jgi:serine/threonine protein kinase
MWSLGCILSELATGRALFPAVDENELLEFFNMMIGLPPESMRKRGKKINKFFDKEGNLIKSR